MIPHYPKIWTLGSDTIRDLFVGEVEITEKIDGSLFGFGLDKDKNIVMRSKGKQLFIEEPEKMFKTAIDQVYNREQLLKDLFPPETYFYGEYLQSPHHNILKYERIPKDNIIIFAIRKGQNFVNNYCELVYSSNQLGFETVPRLVNNQQIESVDNLLTILETDSILGNTKIEGIVIKNYWQLTIMGDITICMGKYVSEKFKERHKEGWVTGKDKLQDFINTFRTEARWHKAVQHLKEKGELENDPRDIGKLLKEIHFDIQEEEKENIKEFLYGHFGRQIKAKACAGFPEWYKEQLLKQSIQ